MQSENPFQAPSDRREVPLRAYVSEDRHPADRCPHCQAEVLFRRTLVQGLPFRYRCGRCGGQSVVEMPGLTVFFVIVLVVSMTAAIGLIWLFRAFGPMALGGGLFALIASWLVLEWWWYKRVRRFGRFRPVLYR